MAKYRKTSEDDVVKKGRTSFKPEQQEQRMISLAINLAEKQLKDGTASSAVITHYLKLASGKEKEEIKLLKEQVKLATAKTEAIKSSERIEDLYKDAINAMRRYSGQGGADDEVLSRDDSVR